MEHTLEIATLVHRVKLMMTLCATSLFQGALGTYPHM